MNKLEKIFNIKGKVVAITGGTGYLCGNLAEELLNLGCKVIVLDKNIKKSSKNHPKIIIASSQHHHKTITKSLQNHFKIIPK